MTNPRTRAGCEVRESLDHHDDDSLTIPSASDVPAALVKVEVNRRILT
jgi:hypothetical protein